MTLTVLGSGSSGNGYVLQNETEALILECGCPVKDCLKALKFNTKKVVGCLVTHEHGDHAKYAQQYRNYFKVMASCWTVSMINEYAHEKGKPSVLISYESILLPLKGYKLGNFDILPFPTEHDSKQPFGYLIKHPEIGVLLFATDTYFLRYKFNYLTNIMLECNYDLPILEENVKNGVVAPIVRDRTIHSHMSLEHFKSTMEANDLTGVANIVLLHLSSQNSDPDRFKKEIESLTHKKVHIAKKGLTIPINLTPF